MNIRHPQPGDYDVLQVEIDKFQKERAELEQHNAETTAALKAELAKDAQSFNESEVFEQRQNLAQIEQRQRLVVDRIAALEGRLPTPKQRRDAKKEAKAIVKVTDEARQRFTEGWELFMHALITAHSIGGDVTGARADAKAAIYPLADLVAEHGLDVAVPKLPEPPADETTFAGLLGTQLREVGYHGESDTTTERDLAAARARWDPS